MVIGPGYEVPFPLDFPDQPLPLVKKCGLVSVEQAPFLIKNQLEINIYIIRKDHFSQIQS